MDVPRLVILADDLSGAADCGVMCTQAGLRTLVVLGDQAAAPAVDVLAVDGDTRSLPRDAAAAAMTRLTRRHGGPGQPLFKKVDSTLRGHVGAELAAMLAVRRDAGGGCIVLAPALPGAGRTTAGGVQLLHGAPLERTEAWRTGAPATHAYIPGMLEQAGLRAALVTLGQVRGPDLPGAVAALAAGQDAVVCDAETEADLHAIAAAAAALGGGAIWAGSAGLARHLPGALGLSGPMQGGGIAAVSGPLLFVVGSLSSVSRAQIDALARQAGIRRLTVPPATLWAGPGGAAWARMDRCLDAWLGRGDVALVLGGAAGADLAEGQRLARALGRMAAPHATRIGALVATGGETARAVLQAFNATGLHLLGEVEPGVPLSVAEGIHPLPVITKAGAFGTPDTLLRCRSVLRAGATALPPLPEITGP